MKSWIRRFALLAVMGSIVGGVVMTGCSTPPEEGTDTTVEQSTPEAPPAEPEATPEAPPAE